LIQLDFDLPSSPKAEPLAFLVEILVKVLVIQLAVYDRVMPLAIRIVSLATTGDGRQDCYRITSFK